MRTSRIVSVAAAAFVMQLTATSFAQPEAAPPPPAPAPATAPATAPGLAPATPTTPTTAPAPAPEPAPAPAPPPAVAPAPAEPAPAEPVAPAAPPPAAEAEQADTDHNMMIGRVAFGYLGRRTVGIAAGAPGALAPDSVDAPIVGIRYWLAGSIGLDLGLGFSSTSGTQEDNIGGISTSNDLAGTTAVLIHAGVPLALAGSQHFSFQITPEMNVGVASRTEQDPAGGPDIDYGGVHFDVGARVGGEVHWGFLGIPELSLQGSVGVRLDVDTLTVSAGPNESTRTDVRFTTDDYNNPWDVLTTQVAALYYF